MWQMPSCRRWPKALLDAMNATNNFSKAYVRMQKLCELYECEATCTRFTAEDQYSWSSFRKDVNDRIQTFPDEKWKGGI